MKKINEEKFSFRDLPEDEKEQIYTVFKDSYEKAVGTSWDKDKFYGRAHGWYFFGTKTGFISVRIQNSGLYKLVGVAGDANGILTGLSELMSLGKPIWGMVDKKIQLMAIRKGFKTPPGLLLKIMYKFIPKSVFGGTDFVINNDGSLTLKYQDVGDAKKYFIGNDEYFSKLKSDIWPTIKTQMTNIPSIAMKAIEKLFEEQTKPSKLISISKKDKLKMMIELIVSNKMRGRL